VRSIEIAGFLSNIYRSLFICIQVSFMRSNLPILKEKLSGAEYRKRSLLFIYLRSLFTFMYVSFVWFNLRLKIPACSTCRLLACRVFLYVSFYAYVGLFVRFLSIYIKRNL